jgi:FkbM family methyltransferase
VEASVQAEVRASMAQNLALLESIQREVTHLRSEIWHAKAIQLDGHVLAGCRHLELIYLINPDDNLLGPRFLMDGECEPDTTAFLRRTVKPTDVCIDVGANFGYFTCLMAKLAWQGRTMAFEADQQMCTLARRNILINWCENGAEIFNYAVGAEDGEMTLYRRVGRAGNTSIIRMTPEELEAFDEPPSEPFTVECVALDRYAVELPKVDVVKIDVEGAESLVLAGMQKLVERHKPVIVMEWSPGQTERAGFATRDLAATIDKLELVPHVIRPGGELERKSIADLLTLGYQNIVLKS